MQQLSTSTSFTKTVAFLLTVRITISFSGTTTRTSTGASTSTCTFTCTFGPETMLREALGPC